MKTCIQRWNKTDLNEAVEIAFVSLQASTATTRETRTLDDVRNWLNSQQFSDQSMASLVYSDNRLVGWLLLIPQNHRKLMMNPWGIHPFMDPEFDRKKTTSILLQESTRWANQEGFEVIEFYAQQSMEDVSYHEDYKQQYESCDIHAKGYTVDMQLDLSKSELVSKKSQPNFLLTSIEECSMDDLYSCYYSAFTEEKLWYFMEQNEEEKRAYFDELASMDLETKSSLVLKKNQKIVGFTFVIPYGENTNRHLTCICIHPDFGRRGLGRFLLNETQKRVAQQGCETMTLYTDYGIRAYDLYVKNGWEVTEKYTPYVWKKLIE